MCQYLKILLKYLQLINFLEILLYQKFHDLEHFIERGIFLIIVFGVTRLFSKANAIVKVLKIEPSS